MNSYGRVAQDPTRAQRSFWFVDEWEVRRVVGHECTSPSNPAGDPKNFWWVPSIGFSCGVGTSLFYDKLEAEAKLRSNLIARKVKLTTDLILVEEALR